jgi:flagellar assembly factor FliW
MQQASAALTKDSETVEAPSEPISIRTRFGEMVVDPASTLSLPRGLMGFAHLRDYALATLPEERFGQFKLLQSLQEADVSFIVAPYTPGDGLIAEQDISDAFQTLGIGNGDGAVLLVVSIRKMGDKPSVSVNLRAPLIVDVAKRAAWQFVLSNPEYSVRHAI